MKKSLENLILESIKRNKLDVFTTSMFLDLGNYKAISKCLERMVNKKIIRRISRGLYDKPKYNKKYESYSSIDIEKVAEVIAKEFNWDICPSPNYALNLLGLSTQVPAKYVYTSNGPYRSYNIDGTTIDFKHTNNKAIGNFSYKTLIVIQALKAIGADNLTAKDIEILRKNLTFKEKEILLKEGIKTNIWIYEVIRKICRR